LEIQELVATLASHLRPATITLLGLWMTGGQDIAVSAVSGLASTLLVLATLLLGTEIGGPWWACPPCSWWLSIPIS